jgi:fatty acid desaturase
MTHHINLGSYALDLDLKNKKVINIEAKLTKGATLRHILTPILGSHFRRSMGINVSLIDKFPIFILKLILVTGALLFTLFVSIAALLFLVLPYIWIYTAINDWTDCIDHGGLLNAEDDLSKSRNLVLPLWIRVIIFPRNDCFHLVHHLFPAVLMRYLEYCNLTLVGNHEYDD